MKTRHWVLLVLAIAVLGVGVTSLVHGPTKAFLSDLFITRVQAEGHSLSYWMNALESPDEEERKHACQAIGSLTHDAGDAVPALAKHLTDDPARSVRIEASCALTKVGPASAASAVPALAQAVEDKDGWVRMNAATALAQMKSEPRLKQAIPTLRKALKDKANQTNLKNFNYTIQCQIARALARATAGTDEAVQDLVDALQTALDEHKGFSFKSDMEQGQQQMRRGAPGRSQESNPEQVKNATDNVVFIETKVLFIRALGELGSQAKGALPILEKILANKEDESGKRECQEAIESIQGHAAQPAK